MNLPLYIARRLRIGTSGHRKSPAIPLAITAVALSLMIMMATIAITSGFKNEITNRIAGFNSHITLLPPIATSNDTTRFILRLDSTLLSTLLSLEFIKDIYLEANTLSVLKTSDEFKGIYLRGVESIPDVVADNIISGSIQLDSTSIIISAKSASELSVTTGDSITTYLGGENSVAAARKMKIASIFNTGFSDYDSNYAFVSLKMMQNLCLFSENEGTAIQIITTDPNKIDLYTTQIYYSISNLYATKKINELPQITNIRKQGASYFSWLALLDTNVIVVLVIMTVVACITLVAAMLIIITEKRKLIGTLRALGVSGKTIRYIFVLLATRIGLTGILIGNIFALPLLWLQYKTHFIPLEANTYYIDFVPIKIDSISILLLNIAIVSIVWFSLLLPSKMAASMNPSVTLRYE